MKNNTLIVIGFVILVGAGGFFAGMQYQKGQRSFPGRQFDGFQGQSGTGGAGRNRSGARPVAGEVLSSDDKSITVKLQEGSSKIVLVTGSTSINKATAGAKSDLTTGVRVAAFGTENTDGTLTAINVQINPAFGGTKAPQQ